MTVHAYVDMHFPIVILFMSLRQNQVISYVVVGKYCMRMSGLFTYSCWVFLVKLGSCDLFESTRVPLGKYVTYLLWITSAFKHLSREPMYLSEGPNYMQKTLWAQTKHHGQTLTLCEMSTLSVPTCFQRKQCAWSLL